jgi:hypothetical protein
MRTCPKCHYIRTPEETASFWLCPKCGTAYGRDGREFTGVNKWLVQKFPDKSISYHEVQMRGVDYASLMVFPVGLFLYLSYKYIAFPHNLKGAITLYVLCCVLYLPVTWIMLRELRLRGLPRAPIRRT